jgi:hypothetical protein
MRDFPGKSRSTRHNPGRGIMDEFVEERLVIRPSGWKLLAKRHPDENC